MSMSIGFEHVSAIATRCAIKLCHFITYLPSRLQLLCGRILGIIIVSVLPSRAAVMRRNIARCFPEYSDAERRQLYKDNRFNLGMGVIEAVTALLQSNVRIRQLFTVEGYDCMKQHYSNQEAVILLMPHYTHMMLIIRICTLLFPTCLLRRRQNNPVLDRITVEKCNQHLYAMCTQSDMRAVLKLLREKQVVIVLPDHDLGRKRSVFAPFFGIPTATITAVSKMTAFANAKVVAVRSYRDGHSHYHVQFVDITEQITCVDAQQDATTINSLFESWIRQNPSQYYWCHRRFKTRPIGETNFYA